MSIPIKTLVLTSCCKEKRNRPAPAQDLYIGKLFSLVRLYAQRNHFDWRIISAMYGLVTPGQVIAPYDAQVQYAEDVARVQHLVLPELRQIWGNYQRVVVIMGKMYRLVIAPVLKHQLPWTQDPRTVIVVIEDHRGIGGYLQRMQVLLDEMPYLAAQQLDRCPVCGGIIMGDMNAMHQGFFTCAICGWRSAPCCGACKQNHEEARAEP